MSIAAGFHLVIEVVVLHLSSSTGWKKKKIVTGNRFYRGQVVSRDGGIYPFAKYDLGKNARVAVSEIKQFPARNGSPSCKSRMASQRQLTCIEAGSSSQCFKATFLVFSFEQGNEDSKYTIES